MNSKTNTHSVLVLGGRGFIGRHIVKQLRRLGANVTIGTRAKHRRPAPDEQKVCLHNIEQVDDWVPLISRYDVVINTVGILRERHHESYDRIHHRAMADLATACHRTQTRLIHISAIGLDQPVSSRFLTSKRRGEMAIKSSNADWYIVRPSLVDGDGGYGARWFRRVARWPVRLIPASANGQLAPIDANDLGEAVARLALRQRFPNNENEREIELGGEQQFDIAGYLDALAPKRPTVHIFIPGVFARLAAHLFDLLHLTPYSYGHHELLKYDNLPAHNRLPDLLKRPARQIGHARSRHACPEVLVSEGASQ